MALFKFAVRGQHIDLLTPTKGISDEYDVSSAIFHFHSPDWEKADKWAHFVNPGDIAHPILANLIDDGITPDRGLNLEPGIWDVFVHGDVEENGEIVQRLVSETVSIEIILSGILNDEVFPEFDEVIAEQILLDSNAAHDAYITGATVTRIDGAGVPYCETSITGDPGNRVVNFVFHNLDGKAITSMVIDENGAVVTTLEDGSVITTDCITDFYENEWPHYTVIDEHDDGNIQIVGVNIG